VRLTRGSSLFSAVSVDPLTNIFAPLSLNQLLAAFDG
jgi:hypothetical protein